MMKKVFIPLLLLFVMAFSLPLAAQFNAEEMLPAKTLLYASVTDGKKLCEDMQQLGLWQLFQSREWQDFFATLPAEYLQQFEMQKTMVEQRLGMPVAKMLEIFHGQIAIAVVGMAEGSPVPTVVLTWDLGAQKETFAQLFAAIRPQLYPMARGMREDNMDINGHPVVMITTPVKMPVFLTYIANSLVICSDRDFLETLIVPEKKTTEPLAAFPAYVKVKTELLAGRAGKLVYANVKEMIALGLAMSGRKRRQIEPMVEMSGLNKVEAFGFGISFRNSQVTESFYIYTPEGRAGIFGGIVPALQNEGLLTSYLPQNPIAFNHGSVDWMSIYKTYMGLFEQMAPREYQGMMAMKKNFEEDFGINLEADILGSIGNEYLSSLSLSGGLLPDLAIQFAIKDMSKFQAALQKVLTVVPKKYRYDFTWNGHNFTYFNFSTMSQPLPLAPTIAIENNRLLLTLFPETAKNMITQNQGQLPADTLKYLNGRKYAITEYFNLKAVAGPIYRTLVPLAQALTPREQMPIELALLPAAQTVENYLNNAVFIGIQNNEGILWEFYSPAGVMPFMIAGGVAGAMAPKRRHYRHEPPDRPRPPVEHKPVVVETPAPGEGLKSHLLTLEENRKWKSTAAEMESILESIWVSNASLNLKLHVAFPANTFAYGNLTFSQCQDNLGTNLISSDTENMKLQMKKLYTYDLEKIRDNKGYNLDIYLGAPAREAKTFSAKGQFTLKLAGETTEISIPEYGKWKAAGHQVEGFAITVLPVAAAAAETTSIQMETSEDLMKIINVVVVDGDNKDASNGYNSYQKDASTHNITYWFSKPIPDTATVVIQYLKSLEEKTVVIDINNQTLP
jgi:hypothetical protein